MTKSLSKRRIVKPPLDRFGGVRIVQKRIQKSEVLEHHKDAVAQELIDIATSSIDEIIDWDSSGYVRVKSPDEISNKAIKAIKKIKMTPTREGPQLEVELHDKVSVLRTLAKATGMLDKQEDMDKPSVVGIVMHGPEQPIIDVEPVNETKKDGDTRDTNYPEDDAEEQDKPPTGSNE